MTKIRSHISCDINGKNYDDCVKYDIETDSYRLYFTLDLLRCLGALNVTITEATTQATTNNFWVDGSLNSSKYIEKAYTDRLQSKLTSATQQISNSQPQKKMTRLTTSGDWTIALNESNKLVAFDSNGTTITAVGSLLSADGKAWMWKDGKLWSGVLEQTLTEAQEEEQRILEAESLVAAKYQQKMQRLKDKQTELSKKRLVELAKILNG